MSEVLKHYSYYETGGTCDRLYLPTTIAEAALAVKEIAAVGARHFILGGGTNSLVWDDHYPGAVISLTKMREMRIEGNTIICQGGVDNTALAEMALTHQLSGVAWMNRLPGQVGGTTRMNARCYGGEMSQVVGKITVVNRVGTIAYYSDPSVFRGYKNTLFMDNGDLIVEVDVHLQPGHAGKIKEQMDFCQSDREGKDQFTYPSCGCVFKNDYKVGVPSGLLLDRAGVKGLSHGGCQVSSKHCNFVFNKGATSREILELTFTMQDRVWDKFGVWLEYEMEILGLLPPELNQRYLERRQSQAKEDLLQPLRVEFSARG